MSIDHDPLRTLDQKNRPRASSSWAFVCVASLILVTPACENFSPTDRGGSAEVGPGGRQQTLALTPAQELAVGRQSYHEVMKEFQGRIQADDSTESRRVHRVIDSLVEASRIEPLQREILLHTRGYRFEWDVHVVRERQINAFCLPAGKIIVFTGILPVAKNDDQLAAVLAHEMAHALAHHASERVARERSGSNILRRLSYDRMQESEADHIGVFLMTFAGYDPNQGVAFWERMQSVEGHAQPPEFLSDHPTPEHRVRNIREWAGQARAAKKAFDAGRISPAR